MNKFLSRMRPVLAFAIGAAVVAVLSVDVAQGAEDDVVLSSNAPISLTVDGLEIGTLPANASTGSTVCVASTAVYLSSVERWVFVGWSQGVASDCFVLTDPGVYVARYSREVLIRVQSPVPAERRSLWLPAGRPVEFEVTDIVPVSDRSRYRFVGWSAGETPFQTKTAFVPLVGSLLEIERIREFMVIVDGGDAGEIAGTGWYAEGSTPTVRAPGVLEIGSASERLIFSGWTSDARPPISFGSPGAAETTFQVNGTFVVRPQYKRQFLVVATGPSGDLKREWIAVNERIDLEVPPVIEVVPERERLVFQRWEGIDGLTSPKITGVVTRPVNLLARYQRQVKVVLEGPFGGGGDGWHPAGATVSLAVPDVMNSKLIFQSRFQQFAGAGTKPTMQLVVQEPVTVVALYVSRINVGIMSLFAGVLLGMSVVWVAYLWVRGRFRY